MFATKLTETISDSSNAKEHYNSYLKRKNTKSVKQKIITQQPKTFENPNIVDKNQLLLNIQKIHINFKTMRQAEKVS